MNVGIVGSRNFNNWKLMNSIVSDYTSLREHGYRMIDPTIVTGDARGADALAVKLARYHDLVVIVHKAHWDLYGKKAGPIRNQKIIDDSDALIAFPSKHGKGTQITIDMAKKKGIPVYVVDDWEENE